jgi:hypothetical protein
MNTGPARGLTARFSSVLNVLSRCSPGVREMAVVDYPDEPRWSTPLVRDIGGREHGFPQSLGYGTSLQVRRWRHRDEAKRGLVRCKKASQAPG